MQLFLRRKHFVVICKFETKEKNYLRPNVYTCMRISHFIMEHSEKIIISRKGIGEKYQFNEFCQFPRLFSTITGSTSLF